jgi:hypothetical protein
VTVNESSVVAWGDVGSPVLPLAFQEFAVENSVSDLLLALGLATTCPRDARFEEQLTEPLQANAVNGAMYGLFARGLDQRPCLGSQIGRLEGADGDSVSEALMRLPLRTRTLNALLRHLDGIEELGGFLGRATLGDLLDIRNFGAMSLLDLLVGLDQAVELGWLQSVDGSAPGTPSANGEAKTRPLAPQHSEVVTYQDGRFRDLVPLTNLEELIETAPAWRWEQIQLTCDEAADRIDHLSHLALEVELQVLVDSGLGGLAARWGTIIARRFGLDAVRLPTLDELGRECNVTRERVRQIQSKMLKGLPPAPIWAPATQQMIELVDVMIPCTASALSEALREAGLTQRATWDAGCLVALAGLTGRVLDLA